MYLPVFNFADIKLCLYMPDIASRFRFVYLYLSSFVKHRPIGCVCGLSLCFVYVCVHQGRGNDFFLGGGGQKC